MSLQRTANAINTANTADTANTANATNAGNDANGAIWWPLQVWFGNSQLKASQIIWVV